MSKYLKTLKGALSFDNFKKGLQFSEKVLKGIRGIDKLARELDIEPVRRFTDKLIKSESFNKAERAINVGQGISSAIDTSRNTGLFNKPPRRSSIVELKSDEQRMAEQIAMNMR